MFVHIFLVSYSIKSNILGLQQTEWDKEHAKHYIDYIDSTFTSEGHVPNMAEAEEVFQKLA